MSTVYESLIKRLDSGVRVSIQRRTDAMMRQVEFLREQQHPQLVYIQQRGWTNARINVLCSLNSFYQIVIGPLASSARRTTKIGLGDRIPIDYGEEIRFDEKRSSELRAVHAAFLGIVRQTNLPDRFLYANHADDLIFEISRVLNASPDRPVD